MENAICLCTTTHSDRKQLRPRYRERDPVLALTMAVPISMISVANQATIEYSKVKIERKETGKRMAEEEKTRIEEWQRGLETGKVSQTSGFAMLTSQ